MNFRISLLLALGFFLVSCGDSSKKEEKQEPEISKEITPLAEPSAEMASIQMQKWEVTDLIYDDDGMGIALEKKPYLIFRDGRASGFAGCNSMVGEYVEGENYGLNFNNMASTKKMCPEAAVTETRLLELLEGAYSYELNSDKTKLKIKSVKGQINLALR